MGFDARHSLGRRLSIAETLEEDSIYILDEDNDEDANDASLDRQTVLDLQLQLSITSKRLAVTENAYRALEDDYVALRDGHSLALVLLADLELAGSLTTSSFEAGHSAASRLIALVRTHIAQHSEGTSAPAILLAWIPPNNSSRDFLQGFASHSSTMLVENSGSSKLRHILDTLYPSKLLKQVYVSASKSLAPILTHIVVGTVESAVEQNTNSLTAALGSTAQPNGHHNGSSNLPSSPTARRRRSWTSMSSLSSMSRTSTISDATLSKITLLCPSLADIRIKPSLDALRDAVYEAFEGRDITPRELLELDFDTMFSKLEAPEILEVQLAETDSAWANVVQKGRRSSSMSVTNGHIVAKSSEVTAATHSATVSTSAAASHIASNGDDLVLTPRAATSDTQAWADASASHHARRRSSSSTTNGYNKVNTNSKKPSSKSGARDSSSTADSAVLDPSVSLCKQKKPPCNQFYLTKRSCTNPKCNYSHAYHLSEKQIEEMRTGAAKTACIYRIKNLPCMSGDECVFGHKCPQGDECKYKDKGRCQFPPHMH